MRTKSPLKMKPIVQIHCSKGNHAGCENRMFRPKIIMSTLKDMIKLKEI